MNSLSFALDFFLINFFFYNVYRLGFTSSEEISNLLKKAKSSDESRKLLIEKCMYLIDEYLISAQFDSNFTKEDARQEGYLFLTRRVNAFLDSHQESGLEYGPFTIYLR